MDIFKKFLVVFMHIVSLWACSCLVRFLVGISQSSYKIPIQYIMPMVIFYGGLTLMTVFYWIARFHQKKKLSDNTASINLESKENIESNAKSTENNINVDRIKEVINNISSEVLKCFKGVNKDMIFKIVKAGLIPVCALLVIGGVGFGIYKVIEANSIPACDSSYAEERLIKYYNKEIRGIFNANHVEVSLPVTESYDKEVKKYECKADITISYHSDHVPYLNGNSGDMIYDCISYYDIQKSKGEIVMFFSEPKSCTLNWASWNY